MQPQNPWGAPPPGAPGPDHRWAPPANPYAPPQAIPSGPHAVAGQGFGAWMDGDQLVVQKDAPLPDACFKCGAGAVTHRKNRQFVWTPPWVIVMYLISPIIGVIAALFVQKKGRLHIPLCTPCHGRWQQGIVLAIVAVVVLLAGIIGGSFALAADEGVIGALLIVFGLAALIAIAITNRNRFLRSTKVDDHAIWLAQVHPDAIAAVLAAAQGAPR